MARLRLKGSCNGCGASSSTLELAVEKALRGDRARPARDGRRGRGGVRGSRERRCRWPPAGSNGDASLPGARLVGRARGHRRPRRRRDARRRGGGQARWWWPAWRAACWPTATAAPPAAPRLGGATLSEGVLACPSCAPHVLPAARRALAGRRAAPARAGAAAGRRPGRRAGGAVVVSGFMSGGDRSQAQAVASLRRLQMRQMPEGPEPIEASCDLCGTSMPEDHRHLLQIDERSIVCVCECCWALRSGDAEFLPTGSRVLPLRTSSSGRPVGALPHPDRARLLPAHRRRDGGLLPEPRGGDRVRARPGGLGRPRGAQPGPRRAASPRPRC